MRTMVGASRRYDGPLGKSDRALVFGTLGFWIGIRAPLPAWLGAIVPVVAALLLRPVSASGKVSRFSAFPSETTRQRPRLVGSDSTT